MRAFAELYQALDQTNKTNAKVELLQHYFQHAPDTDKLWLLAFFSGRGIKRTVTSTQLRQWCQEYAGVDAWLFDECYDVVGDLAETIALILPVKQTEGTTLSLTECIERIRSMGRKPDEEKKAILYDIWSVLNTFERFVFNKLITGGFRIGVSQKLVCRALSLQTGVEENILAHRLMGNWNADNTDFHSLVLDTRDNDDHSRPYPFYLAYPLEQDPAELGDPSDWQAEWKWDGIRGQLIVRGGELYVWSRGEELVTARFPEFHALVDLLPDGTALDGEILPYRNSMPLAFQQLQTRVNRKVAGKKLMNDVPVVFMAYDVLETDGIDRRGEPLSMRRHRLEAICGLVNDHSRLILSPVVEFNSWEELSERREEARLNLSEGLMLKHLNSVYDVGRKKGYWWKWKVNPYTIDAVLIYAQSGHGRRANMFTDYTFALWDGPLLVPFAKAYSGLTDEEIRKVDAFVKQNTKEKFGPVRSVKAVHVFELAFEGINKSTRHKSGVAVRFPRILRWRTDKKPEDANTLDELKAMIRE